MLDTKGKEILQATSLYFFFSRQNNIKYISIFSSYSQEYKILSYNKVYLWADQLMQHIFHSRTHVNEEFLCHV